MPKGEQIYINDNPQVYCADCLHYGDGHTFPGQIFEEEGIDMEVGPICPDCGGERVFALTQEKKDEIDVMRREAVEQFGFNPDAVAGILEVDFIPQR